MTMTPQAAPTLDLKAVCDRMGDRFFGRADHGAILGDTSPVPAIPETLAKQLFRPIDRNSGLLHIDVDQLIFIPKGFSMHELNKTLTGLGYPHRV